MAEFLVELYLPRRLAGAAEEVSERARLAAERIDRGGTDDVRHLQSIFVPADETCFLLYCATSAEAARDAALLSELRVERVSEAVLSWTQPFPATSNERDRT